MESGEVAGTVNLDSFTLDFMERDPNEGAWDEEGERILDNEDVLAQMLDAIPSEAIELGTLEDEVDNWTSWQTNDRYFVTPWEGEGFEWTLFRISWDDNWGRYGWESCARASGIKEGRSAGRMMFKALIESWGYDLDGGEHEAYRNFLDQI